MTPPLNESISTLAGTQHPFLKVQATVEESSQVNDQSTPLEYVKVNDKQSVSYTHLDVYKRQGTNFVFNNNKECINWW